MNRYKLFWVIFSFAEWWVRSRKVLVIYWSFSFVYPLFASLKCLSCQLPTPGIDIHLHQTIPLTTKPKISTVNLSISNGLSKQCSLPKKQWKKTRPILPLKRVEIRGSNKKTKNSLSVSPFPPSPLNILPSIRSGFDQVPTSYEPLFGSAKQVTKVCYTLPT